MVSAGVGAVTVGVWSRWGDGNAKYHLASEMFCFPQQTSMGTSRIKFYCKQKDLYSRHVGKKNI